MFFRSRDPLALRAPYSEHLGIPMEDYGTTFSAREGDQTAWSPFPAETDYSGSAAQQANVNYRVRDLDATLAQRRSAGAHVDLRVEEHEHGRFGWAIDSEGNRFELWQPPA